MIRTIRRSAAVLALASSAALAAPAFAQQTVPHKHHSVLKGAVAGAVAGHMTHHKHGALAGAAIGAAIQHHRNHKAMTTTP